MNIGDFLLSGLDIPQELIKNMPVLSIYGRDNLLLDNFLMLKEISEERLVISTALGELCIMGKKLQISFIRQGTIGIGGMLYSVNWGE